MKNYNVLHILELFHIYKGMGYQEKHDFYQKKCDYYQFFVKLILILSGFASLSYLVSDYQLNGNTIMPTLLPRTFILIPLAFYILLEPRAKSRYTTLRLRRISVRELPS